MQRRIGTVTLQIVIYIYHHRREGMNHSDIVEGKDTTDKLHKNLKSLVELTSRAIICSVSLPSHQDSFTTR